MLKYFLSLIVLGIAISISFAQCKAPALAKAQHKSQHDASILVVTSESESRTDPSVMQLDTFEAISTNRPKITAVETLEAPIVERSEVVILEKPVVTTVQKAIEPTVGIPKATNVERHEVATGYKSEIPTSKKLVATTVEKPMATIVEKPKAENDEKPSSSNIDKPTSLTPAEFSLTPLKATVSGTSTLHDWESQVTVMEGKGSFQLKDNVLASIKDAEVKIAVKGIISEKGSKMDNKTYETFKSDQYPYIIYSFSNAAVKINESKVVSIETTGTLSMAGESKSVSLLANGKVLANGDLQLSVSKIIKMTDYKMKRPVMFLGTIKVGDEITVRFDFVLSKINK